MLTHEEEMNSPIQFHQKIQLILFVVISTYKKEILNKQIYRAKDFTVKVFYRY